MSTPCIDLQPPVAAPAPRGPIHALTGLRFFAALHVVVFHLWIHFKADFAAVPAWAMNVATCGYVGVPLFFLLSGFVMAVTYLHPSSERAPFDARRYWIARLARIYPVYCLSLLLSAPFFIAFKFSGDLGLAGTLKGVVNALMHGLLLQSWYPKIILDWNPPAWSLSVEAFFYAVFPFVVTSLGLTRLDRAGLLRAAACLWGLSVALSCLALQIPQAFVGWDGELVAGIRDAFPLLRLPDFLLGVVVGRLFLLRPTAGSHAHGMGRLCAGVAIAMLGAMALIPEASSENLVSSLMLLPCAVFLYALAHQSAGGWLERPGLRVLGEASYSLYILHWPLIIVAKQWLFRLADVPVVTSPLFYHPALVVLMVGLSVAVYRYFEVPMRDSIKRALA